MEEELSWRETFLVMTRVHIFCEGQTEETFVREVLQDHFNRRGVYLTAMLRGGTTYGKAQRDIIRLCKQDSSAYVHQPY
jgi:hypothetical protein